MARTPEAVVKATVKKWLVAVFAWFYMPVSNGMGRVGAPDFICCVPYVVQPEDVGRTVGLFLGIETKAPGKRGNTTANQDREIAAIREAGGLAIVVDDVSQLDGIL